MSIGLHPQVYTLSRIECIVRFHWNEGKHFHISLICQRGSETRVPGISKLSVANSKTLNSQDIPVHQVTTFLSRVVVALGAALKLTPS